MMKPKGGNALAVLIGEPDEPSDSREKLASKLIEAVKEDDAGMVADAMDAYCADWMERMKAEKNDKNEESEEEDY